MRARPSRIDSSNLEVNWFLPSQKLVHKVRTGSHITKMYDNAQTPCARKDASKETKKCLRAIRAELDIITLLHEIFLCQEQLNEITKRKQPLVIKKRGNYASISGEFTT